MSEQATRSIPSSTASPPVNLASSLRQAGPTDAAKPKPCCVCKDEKSSRDECMLFSSSADPIRGECKDQVVRYRECMKGFGFEI